MVFLNKKERWEDPGLSKEGEEEDTGRNILSTSSSKRGLTTDPDRRDPAKVMVPISHRSVKRGPGLVRQK